MQELCGLMSTTTNFKAGFVNIVGLPNAGKSTLLNAVLGEHLAIVSNKVQTTRHRILGIYNTAHCQIVFSDTPGIIDEPRYKLHEKMMKQVGDASTGADATILLHDINSPLEYLEPVLAFAKKAKNRLLIFNKIDQVDPQELPTVQAALTAQFKDYKVFFISAIKNEGIEALLTTLTDMMPESEAYYPEDFISDRPMRFFAAELIREQIFTQFKDEIPYHTTVLVQEYKEKSTLTLIRADIIVSRETQKMILLGKGGSAIKQLGIAARQAIEQFIDGKVHLELFIKVRPKWRDNDLFLKEYGYH
jgi:GTP-binding protein Era